ncbi:hypothetical protein [Clostridium lundense]|uniref:hypothetical protein n=1 Tax=Clostridium lundense TaxID=319475 RepID=UPI0004894AF5|nr:hypothetical protein [Clostridium lundense]
MIPIKLKDTSIIDRHYDAVKEFLNTPKIKYKYIDIDKWVCKVTSNKYDLEKVIKAKPKELVQIIKAVQGNIKNSYNDENNKGVKRSDYSLAHYFLHIYEKFSNLGDKHFTKIGYNALDLVNTLEMNVCPYCNRNFISNTKLVDEKGIEYIKRTAQLDHYYPESEYPFLAISFYNLIPVCPSCNKVKLAEEFGVNPYEIQNSDEHLIFDYNFSGSIKNVKIDTVYISKDFKKNWNALGLEELYQAHNNYLSDLLIRIKIYNTLYRNDLNKYLSKWSSKSSTDVSEIVAEDIKRVLIGNYYLEEDLNKQPLSKLTKDIVRQHL